MVQREVAEAHVKEFEAAMIEADSGEDPYALLRQIVDWIREHDMLLGAMRSREAMISFLQAFPSEAESTTDSR